jgi:alpha-glucosidase
MALLSCAQPGKSLYKVTSPEGVVHMQFMLTATGQPAYQVYFRDKLMLDTSLMGFDLNKAPDLSGQFKIISTTQSTFDETWEQPWGEERFIRNHYNEFFVRLQERSDLKRLLNVRFRIYDDGVGFRYEFPEQENLRHVEIIDEYTEFAMADDYMAWWIPAFQPIQFEYLYRHTPLSEMGVVHTPVTFETKEGYCISLHEAALKDYTSMTVDATSGTTTLAAHLYPYSNDEESRAFVSTPSVTPWRTIQLAANAGDLITSYLILNLNEPNQLGDVSWVKPGKYIGVWWELHLGKTTWSQGPQHGATTANVKRYIDFAAAHGFDGVLAEGWNEGWDGDWTKNIFDFTKAYPDFDMAALSAYAASQNVYLVGHHETGANVDNYEQQMPEAFDLMSKYGYKVVKTGYVESGNMLTNGKCHFGQSYVDHFKKVYMLAAQHKISIVAHEPIKDTGERRTYPNMLSREGARGQEFNAWSDDGGNPPNHEVILPFTRMLSGPMDFTPGVFDLTLPDKPKNQVNTTLAKQLALYVILYSPVQMACDLPENYMKYPDAFQFIKDVGVDWETTRVLDAKIGESIAIARRQRNADDWFVGAATNEHAREVEIDFSFLADKQQYKLTIYRDGEHAHYRDMPESYLIETKMVSSADKMKVRLAPGGGMAMSLMAVKS